ncbi:MAG: DUF2279 domain-containing protein [Bacteroidia bacterium]
MKGCIHTLLILVLLTSGLKGQNFLVPARTYDSPRVNGVALGEGIAFTGTLLALHYLWYKSYHHTRFHYFNDNAEWLQMDKLGHACTAYNVGALGTDVYRWTGLDQQHSIWYGGLTGLVFLTTVEIFDGFSSGWGFSGGDMLANTAGTALVVGQYLGWNEQRLQLKFSYHHSIYASYRPDQLGSNMAQRWLKDYNGQTYWLSGNISSFLPSGAGIPNWLNVSIGYGADGMISARKNSDAPLQPDGSTPVFERSRRFFLAPDIDLTRLHSDDPLVTTILRPVNILKIPAPSLEFRPGLKKWKLHALYF